MAGPPDRPHSPSRLPGTSTSPDWRDRGRGANRGGNAPPPRRPRIPQRLFAAHPTPDGFARAALIARRVSVGGDSLRVRVRELQQQGQPHALLDEVAVLSRPEWGDSRVDELADWLAGILEKYTGRQSRRGGTGQSDDRLSLFAPAATTTRGRAPGPQAFARRRRGPARPRRPGCDAR